MNFIDKLLLRLFRRIKKIDQKDTYDGYRRQHDLHPTFRFNGPEILFSGDGKITAGEGTYVGAYSMILPKQGSPVSIGKFCSISHYVVIYTKNVAATQDFSLPAEQWQMRSGAVRIGDYCWIGYGVIILEGVTIGDNVVIGANSVVTSDLESNGIYAGSPAKLVKAKVPAAGLLLASGTETPIHR